MAMFPLRNKDEEAEQLFTTFPKGLINVSAELYNVLARAAMERMHEKRVRAIDMKTLKEIEAACYKENPRTSVAVVPREGGHVYLRLMVLAMEEEKNSWERAMTVKVLFPITGHKEAETKRDQDRFLELLVASTRIYGEIEGGGLLVRVRLFCNNLPVEQENPDDRHGRAWKYFVRRGELV